VNVSVANPVTPPTEVTEKTRRSKLSPPAVRMCVLLVCTDVKLPDATADGCAGAGEAHPARAATSTAVLETTVRMTLLLMSYLPTCRALQGRRTRSSWRSRAAP
jgi:hypothetical protein